jgi:hypothetical protein
MRPRVMAREDTRHERADRFRYALVSWVLSQPESTETHAKASTATMKKITSTGPWLTRGERASGDQESHAGDRAVACPAGLAVGGEAAGEHQACGDQGEERQRGDGEMQVAVPPWMLGVPDSAPAGKPFIGSARKIPEAIRPTRSPAHVTPTCR